MKLLPKKIMDNSNNKAVSHGSKRAIPAMTVEPPSSMVANAGLPNPAVVPVEVDRARTVEP